MYSLHPVTTDDVTAFLSECTTNASERRAVQRGAVGLQWLERGDSRAPDLVSHALATFLAEQRPSFVLFEISLTNWEAQIDRGVGMLLRPPARLLIDAGMERALAQRFPIRLDHTKGMMGGAFVPPHLIGQLERLLEDRLERHLRRLVEANLDAVANMGLMLQALAYAREQGTGLLEAIDVVDDLDPSMRVVVADRKRLPRELRSRLEVKAKPPRRPGLLARMLGAKDPIADEQARIRAFSSGHQASDDAPVS